MKSKIVKFRTSVSDKVIALLQGGVMVEVASAVKSQDKALLKAAVACLAGKTTDDVLSGSNIIEMLGGKQGLSAATIRSVVGDELAQVVIGDCEMPNGTEVGVSFA